MECFAKIVNGLKTITIFAKKVPSSMFNMVLNTPLDSFQRLRKQYEGLYETSIIFFKKHHCLMRKKMREGCHSKYCNETLTQVRCTLSFPLLFVKDKDGIVFTDFFI